MAWGTLIHGLLEHAMRHRRHARRSAPARDVADRRGAAAAAVIDEALDTVQRVAAADFWAEALSRECCL